MLLHPSHFLFIALTILGVIFTDEVTQALTVTGQWFVHYFGWLMLFSCSFFVLFCGYLAFGKYGKVRLGGKDEQPQFSLPSWLSMLFAAGMGSGLVFYGAAEPLIHFMDPPPSDMVFETPLAQAHHALAVTYFHWGIHAWAIYAIAALTIAYFTFHRKAPMLPSTPISNHPIARSFIDTIAILAVVFGIVATLSQGVLQVSDGMSSQLGMQENTLTFKLVVLLVLFGAYMLSACTGIGKGIKILSNINLLIALAMLLFILFFGPIEFMFDFFVGGVSDYIRQFAALSFDTEHLSNRTTWSEDWSITYLLWWVAWAPFVGVFIARISRGRTIREFMLGVILLPTVLSAIWFGALGGSALYLEIVTQPGFGEIISSPERATYALMETFPIPEISSVIVILLLFIFLVTSADSGAYVLGMFTTDGNTQPPIKERLFWGAMVAIITGGALIQGDSIAFFRSLVVVGAIPYLFIMLWQNWGLWKALKEDERSES